MTTEAQTGGIAVFKRIVSAAAGAGVLTGLVLTLVQFFAVSDLIAQAEVYEARAALQPTRAAASPSASAVASAAPDTAASTATLPGHSHATPSHEHADESSAAPHRHGASEAETAPAPSGRARRILLTAVANISLATGFGLLLCAVIHLRGGVTGWKAGMLWGLAGYTVFFLAPSLGLPPELPGTEALPLAARQQWWLVAVAASAAGLALACWARHWYVKLAGIGLLLAPHLLGAPHLHGAVSAAPAELANAFIGATAFANAVLWLTLGVLSSVFYRKSFTAQVSQPQNGFAGHQDLAG